MKRRLTASEFAEARRLADTALTSGLATVAERTRSYELMELALEEIEHLNSENRRLLGLS